MEKIHIAKVEKGVLIWNYPDIILEHLESFKDGDEVEVVIKKRRDKRTERQNRYLWGIVYKLVADEMGEGINYVHFCLKGKFLTGNRFNKITKKDEVYTPSTTKLNTKQMTQYIEAIRRWAATFLNVNIPSPDEVDLENIIVNYNE